MRKTLLKIIICVISAVLLAGCKGNPESDFNSVQENDINEGVENGIKDEPENVEPGTEPVVDDGSFAAAFKEGRIYNNGHYFVRIGDKVYFRNISPDSWTKVQLSENSCIPSFIPCHVLLSLMMSIHVSGKRSVPWPETENCMHARRDSILQKPFLKCSMPAVRIFMIR